MPFYGEGFDTIFVFAAAIISYALASQIGGNGYLSVYLTGIILGNQELKNQKALVGFFDAFTGMMQMLLFFLLGLLAFPSQMPSIVLPAIAIAFVFNICGAFRRRLACCSHRRNRRSGSIWLFPGRVCAVRRPIVFAIMATAQ